MPIYEFLNSKTGRVEEHSRLIAERDNVPKHLKRIVIPRTVGYANHSGLRETGADADVPKAFREYELSGKSVRTIERETGFSRDHIRRVWRFAIVALFSVTLSARAVDLQAGYTFTPTDHVTSTKLNNLMGLGTINTDFVHLKTAVLPLAADEILIWQSSGAIYRKARFDTAFLSNTNLIIGQTEDTQPTSSDYVLTWDASANALKRAQLDSLIFTNSALINTRSNWAGPANIANGMTLLGAIGGSYYQIGVSNLLTFTNLAVCNIWNGGHEIEVWDVNFGSNRMTSIAGIVTNAATFASLTSTDAFWGYRKSTGNPFQVTPTNIAHFVAQQFTSGYYPLAAGLVANIAHGLSATPQMVTWVLACTNSDAASGYVVGDEMPGLPAAFSGANATNVFAVGNSSSWQVYNKTNGSLLNPTARGNFAAKCYAILFP